MDKDWFTDGWAEDGGVVCDERDSEELPSEDGATAEAGTRELPAESTKGVTYASAEGDRQADLIRFITEYPNVEAGDIPESVWRRAAAGGSLVAAYARYEADTLREENRRLRQSEENRRRSAGSQLGVGAGSRRPDAFDSGWDEVY